MIYSELDTFLKDERLFPNNKWFVIEKYMDVYIRKSKRYIEGELIQFVEIPNINVQEKYQRKGIFTRFLNHLNELNVNIFVENIINPEFSLTFDRKSDFKKLVDDNISQIVCQQSYYKIQNKKNHDGRCF